MKPVSRGIDRIAVTFDDPNLVANAGLLLVATVVPSWVSRTCATPTIRLGTRTGGFQPGRKILTLVHAMVAGATHIDHADMLRAGSTASVLPHRVMAPSTLGTFLRAFSFGHVRQFEKVIGDALGRAWSLGAGPGSNQLVVDIDSTIREVFGKLKAWRRLRLHQGPRLPPDPGHQGRHRRDPPCPAAQGIGQHPARHQALRRRARGPPAPGRGHRPDHHALRLGLLVQRDHQGARAPGGLVTPWPCAPAPRPSTPPFRRSTSRTGSPSSTPPAERRWWPSAPTRVAASSCAAPGSRGPQATLWPNWRHFAFLTDLEGTAVELDAFHRAHAVVELCIDDWKEGAGMEHCPSGDFSANAAWMCCAVFAHNLIRWSAKLGGLVEDDTLVVAQTLRTRYFSVPARLVNRSGTPTLRGPTHWPWATSFTSALTNLRAVAFAPT